MFNHFIDITLIFQISLDTFSSSSNLNCSQFFFNFSSKTICLGMFQYFVYPVGTRKTIYKFQGIFRQIAATGLHYFKLCYAEKCLVALFALNCNQSWWWFISNKVPSQPYFCISWSWLWKYTESESSLPHCCNLVYFTIHPECFFSDFTIQPNNLSL